MLRDVLCRGLEDTEIQMNQDMTLEQVLTFVETKEAGKSSATSDGRDDQQLISEAEETIPTRQEPGSLHILWHQGPWKKPSN